MSIIRELEDKPDGLKKIIFSSGSNLGELNATTKGVTKC